MSKFCRSCKVEKPLSEYYKAGKWHEGRCKDCKNEASRKKHPKIKNKKNTLQRIRYKEKRKDKDYVTARNHRKRMNYTKRMKNEDYRKAFNRKKRKFYSIEKNRKHKNKKQNKRRAIKMKDPIYRENYNKKRREKLEDKCRSRIKNALGGKLKYSTTKKLLGCGFKQVQVHLEKQFDDFMTWQNKGRYGWHIDHKIPIASFDLTSPVDQHVCFWYKNLQPLWAKDNHAKKDKYKEEDKQALIKEWIFFHI